MNGKQRGRRWSVEKKRVRGRWKTLYETEKGEREPGRDLCNVKCKLLIETSPIVFIVQKRREDLVRPTSASYNISEIVKLIVLTHNPNLSYISTEQDGRAPHFTLYTHQLQIYVILIPMSCAEFPSILLLSEPKPLLPLLSFSLFVPPFPFSLFSSGSRLTELSDNTPRLEGRVFLTPWRE